VAGDRFSRQVRFAPFGEAGQERLSGSRVLLVGVGALGTHAATCLVRAGVGAIVLVDRDIVEESNLQRQVLFDEADALAGTPKAIAAAAKLRACNSACAIEPIVADFSADLLAETPQPFDLILDGTDNFATRYLLNDLAVERGIPWIYAAAVGAEGMSLAVLPGTTPCLRCVLPEAPPTGEGPTCETAGILEPVIADVTAFQGAQALKILSGHAEAVARGLYCVDVWSNQRQVLFADLAPDPACRACGTRELPALRAPKPEATSLCGRDAVQVLPGAGARVELELLAAHLRGIAPDLELTPHLLRFSVEGCRFSVFRGGRAILFGISDPVRAKALYDRYVGAR
jgi:adenylyltransferase/sulfurtransferase